MARLLVSHLSLFLLSQIKKNQNVVFESFAKAAAEPIESVKLSQEVQCRRPEVWKEVTTLLRYEKLG
jgi:hypothetical protein